jgi:hypothetical protein
MVLSTENFDTMPAWTETYNAVWNASPTQVVFDIQPLLVGNYLHGYRNEYGSSVRLMQYTVPAATDIYLGVYMRCPTFDPTGSGLSDGRNYWMEAAYKLGVYDAADYDTGSAGPPAWQFINKFDYDPLTSHPNGNGDTWTWYSVGPINTGANTTVSIGFKLGSVYSTGTFIPPLPGPDAGWDGLQVYTVAGDPPPPVPVPAPAPPPPPGPVPPPAPGGGGGRRDHPNGNDEINDSCGCGTASLPIGPSIAWLTLGLFALVPFLRRK